jgi:hypothetical protein
MARVTELNYIEDCDRQPGIRRRPGAMLPRNDRADSGRKLEGSASLGTPRTREGDSAGARKSPAQCHLLNLLVQREELKKLSLSRLYSCGKASRPMHVDDEKPHPVVGTGLCRSPR